MTVQVTPLANLATVFVCVGELVESACADELEVDRTDELEIDKADELEVVVTDVLKVVAGCGLVSCLFRHQRGRHLLESTRPRPPAAKRHTV